MTFERVTLKPGQSKTVDLTLTAKQLTDRHLLQYWSSSAEAWKTAKGIYRVSVGGSFDTSVTDLALVWSW